MRKTFCDRCGAWCVNTTAHFGGHVEHTTSKGETVGIDEIESLDLCKACIEAAREFLGLKIYPQEKPMQMERDRAEYGPGVLVAAPAYEG